jgi:type I restriction enzyme S subunit
LTISAQLGLVSQLEYFNKKVSAQDVSGYYLLNKGDFAYNKSYSKGYPVGAIKLLKYYNKGVVSTLYICFRVKNGFSELFFDQYFDAGIVNSEIGNIAQEGGRAHGLLNVSVREFFKDINLLVPKPQEQQKIASCLSSLDEVIATHSQKLATLKDHKKGLMQNLFPQLSELGLDRLKDDRIKGKEILKSQNPKNHNSDNVPNYRFPEFLEDGEWEEKDLGEICGMQAGKFVSASEIKEKLDPSLFPCYGGNGLRGYTKSFTHSGKFSLIGRQGALCGNITLADGQFHATEHAVVTTPKKNTDTLWLYYELELLNLNQYATGQAQPGLSVGNLVRLKLNIPENPKEQQKIASCLSSLDDLITAQTEKIAQLKLHKKGLMQGLFPKSITN